MRIKVCGITCIYQMHQLDELNIQFAGMIFYEPSSRFVLKHQLYAEEVKRERFKLSKVGVFVNAGYDVIMKTVDAYALDIVQLHGEESEEVCEALSKNIKVMKTFALSNSNDISSTIDPYHHCTSMFLFDTAASDQKGSVQYGGTGQKFNWDCLKELSIDKPFFLSGGIGPGDAELIKIFSKEKVAKDLFAIDINSRFEISPGKKDIELVKKFINDLNAEECDATKAK